MVQLEGVSLCYRLAKQRRGSLKEFLIHVVKGNLEYEELWALQNIDLEVHKGEVLGIVGANGAGKSTLAKVVTGVLKPTRGRCRVRGTIAPILELSTGFDYELTGLENIYLNALLLGHTRKEIDLKVDEIIHFSGLRNFIHTPIRNYSTGMVARLGFAIATAWIPELLILDEALAVGDVRFLHHCKKRIEEFRTAGTTILLISHAITMLLEYSSRCVWLDQGRLVADGEPQPVLADYCRAMDEVRETQAELAKAELVT